MEPHESSWEKRHEILERIEISVRYHHKRERFFDLSDKWVKAIAIFGSSAAFVNLESTDNMRKGIGALIILSSTLALVLSFADRAKRHAELARKFRELDARIVHKGELGYAEADLGVWEAEERMLEANEPPALNALVKICQNEIAVAAGQPNKVVKIPHHQRAMCHLISF